MLSLQQRAYHQRMSPKKCFTSFLQRLPIRYLLAPTRKVTNRKWALTWQKISIFRFFPGFDTKIVFFPNTYYMVFLQHLHSFSTQIFMLIFWKYNKKTTFQNWWSPWLSKTVSQMARTAGSVSVRSRGNCGGTERRGVGGGSKMIMQESKEAVSIQ